MLYTRHCASTGSAQGRLNVTMLLSLKNSVPILIRAVYTHWLSSLPCPFQCTPTGPPTPVLGAALQGHQEHLQLYVLHMCPCVILDFTVHLAPSLLRQSLLLAAGILPVFLQFSNFSFSCSFSGSPSTTGP